MIHGKTPFSDAVEAWGTRARRPTTSDLDITPMIDVTFLLLIFFMVSSTMNPQKGLNVPAAEHGLGIEKSGSTIVYVSIEGPGGGAIPMIQLEGASGQLRDATLDEVRQRIEEAVLANKPHVIIKADGQVEHGSVSEITSMISTIEGASFSIGVRDRKK